ncbi:hypothetical protein SAMN05661086_01774 [Anaeromicropila populeti]|uniref:Uncharacterized protein n=1 Tax=Anaeromicropila populeti TaxID=37658 RepID=A0A1I6JML7_9FIRM|nr:hypothetical protein SAMN05661086_01774 [Anaeromicropila populeti]
MNNKKKTINMCSMLNIYYKTILYIDNNGKNDIIYVTYEEKQIIYFNSIYKLIFIWVLNQSGS